jgi:hypothetical protein
MRGANVFGKLFKIEIIDFRRILYRPKIDWRKRVPGVRNVWSDKANM